MDNEGRLKMNELVASLNTKKLLLRTINGSCDMRSSKEGGSWKKKHHKPLTSEVCPAGRESILAILRTLLPFDRCVITIL